MNEIVLDNMSLPVLNGCDLCVAAEPFFHADRTVDFNIMIYVISGEIYVSEGEADYTVREGELLFLKSGIHHLGKQEIKKGTRWYFAHFYFQSEKNVPDFTPNSDPIIQYEPVRYSAVLPKKLTGLSGSSIESSIISLCDYFHCSDSMKKWNINKKLWELLTAVAFSDVSEEREPTLSERICGFLGHHYDEGFSAEKLEKKFFLSYKYMAAVFKKEKGMTMQQYHNEIRMNKAMSYLKSTLMPVGEISRRLGFSDMLYFSKCFRGFTGQSPTEYRKNAAKIY